MKTWHKVGIGVGAAAVLGGIVLFSVKQVNKGVVTVQTTAVAKQDLSSLVTASGEIKPLTYTNVLGEGFGKITDIAVNEGDHVKKGDVLLRLENIQPTADVDAEQAALSSGEATLRGAGAAFESTQGELAQAKADVAKSKADWERGQELYKAGLIPKSDYDARAAAFASDTAKVEQKTALLMQRRAELDYGRWVLEQGRATLKRAKDVLRKTTYRAAISGEVTFIAVRVGENVVPGIQNSPGSYLMTISDMSVVTAEVMVDETDIINVKNGQSADATIDALPGKVFKGKVTEVGTQAVLRTSGLATTQTTSGTQEAKDFKVVVTLDQPPSGLRPGLSSTAKITTAHKKNVLAIPIQALVVRSRKELEAAAKKNNPGGQAVTLAASKPAEGSASSGKGNDEVQGVFVVRANKAVFVPVQTGISGVTDIEVLTGLKEGDPIITGSYKALRTLKPDAPVKVDNSAPKVPEESQS